jgi:hypothetical protein
MIRKGNVRLNITLLDPEPLFYLDYLLIELTVGNRGTLVAGPSTDSTTQRATAKISIAFFPGDFLDPSDDPNLAMNFTPIEGQRCVWIDIHLA